MAWRASAAEAKALDGPARKAAMEDRIRRGVPVGLLGYLAGEPVAWCSIAPRPSYRPLVRGATPDERIWSIACFFVVRPLRGTGIARRPLAAALKHAREQGATVVEADPVDADSPSYRFMGFVPMFEAAGFREIGREGTRRHVMQRRLRRRAA